MSKVVVIGAGISGLATAFWLMRKGCQVEVFEKDNRAGGVIQTIQQEGYLFERGPNSFLDNSPETFELCKDLQLENELLKQSMRGNARYIYLNNKLHEVPTGPGGLYKTELLSGKTKRRLFTELFRKSNRNLEDESLASFVRRRLGDDILNNLVTPFVSGVYAGDPEALSLRSTFPMLYDLERNHGSLTRGMLSKMFHRKKDNSPPKPRAKNLCSFVEGMETNTKAIARALGERLHLSQPVNHIQKEADGKYVVSVADTGTVHADVVVAASPAYVTATLLKALTPQSAEYLQSIPYNALVIAGMGYSREFIQHDCNGFGFLVPRNQGVRILGSIWNSSLFARRAPGGKMCFSVFIGGGLDPTAIQLSEQEILAQIKTDLHQAVGTCGEPDVHRIFRWDRAIPQYPIGHVERIRVFQEELASHPGLYCIGNYIDGVSTNDCIRKAKETTRQVCQYLNLSS